MTLAATISARKPNTCSTARHIPAVTFGLSRWDLGEIYSVKICAARICLTCRFGLLVRQTVHNLPYDIIADTALCEKGRG